MAVALDNDGLKYLRRLLKSGEYEGGDLMRAWLAIDELIELRNFRDKVLKLHPDIYVAIDTIAN